MPGGPAGSFLSEFLPLDINAADQILLNGRISGGGVNALTDEGLWSTDGDGNLQPIIREGDLLQIAPGDVRTVSAVNASGFSGGEDGMPTALTDSGDFLIYLRFADGTSGYFRGAIPEPSTAILCALAGLVGIRRRR